MPAIYKDFNHFELSQRHMSGMNQGHMFSAMSNISVSHSLIAVMRIFSAYVFY